MTVKRYKLSWTECETVSLTHNIEITADDSEIEAITKRMNVRFVLI